MSPRDEAERLAREARVRARQAGDLLRWRRAEWARAHPAHPPKAAHVPIDATPSEEELGRRALVE